jgi:hypothetical protein
MSYARILYDHGHAVAMMKFAHDDIRQAVASEAFLEPLGGNTVPVRPRLRAPKKLVAQLSAALT